MVSQSYKLSKLDTACSCLKKCLMTYAVGQLYITTMDFSINDPTAYVICSIYSISVFPYFVMFKIRTAVFYLANTCCEYLEQLQKRSVIGCFRFLIQLLIRMKFYIKSHVRLSGIKFSHQV